MPSIDPYILRQMLETNPVVHASTCVADLEYEVETATLTVIFQKRGTYAYHDVPIDEFVLFAGAGSPGTYFNLYIRDQYSFERVA